MRLKTTCLLLCCFFGWSSLWGQDNFCEMTDSLGAASFFEKAQISYAQGKLNAAVDFFGKARDAYEAIGCQQEVFLMNRNILKVYMAIPDAAAFNALFNKIRASASHPIQKADATYQGRVLLLKSNFHMGQKQLDSATVFARKASKIHEKHGAWKYYIRDNNQLALIAYYQQNFEKMERFIDNSFSAYKSYMKEDKAMLQSIMRMYGALYYKTGEYEQALKKTSSALEVALTNMTSLEDTNFVASCYNNIGLFYIELGDIYKAEDYCNNALQLYKKLGNHFNAATTYLNLGEFFAQQGKLEQALAYYKNGIKSLEASEDVDVSSHELDKSFINMYNGIGDVATKLRRYLEASEALKKSLKIHEREEAKKDETFSVLGAHYKAIREFDKAVEYYGKTLSIREQLYGKTHPLIAKVYFDLGETEQKRGNNPEAKEYYNLAKIALELPLAHENSAPSIEDVKEVSDKSILLQILEAKARLLLDEGEVEKAYATTQSAVATLEKMRNGFKEEGSKLFMLQKMIPTYELSIGLAWDLYQKTQRQSYIEDAFQLVEKSKAMLLLDALKAEEARNFGNVPKELLDEERHLARERVRYEKLLFEAKTMGNEEGISNCQKELLKLKRASEKLQTTLEEKYPKYHDLKYHTQIATLEQVQKSLDETTGLIEFFVGNKHIYIFSIYKDTFWMTSVAVNNQFERSIKGLRTALTDLNLLSKDTESASLLFAKNARTIYQKYLEPTLKEKGVERLILIPDGLLNYVPFDVLLTEKPNYAKVDFQKLPYLIKEYNINYHYSSTLKLFSRKTVETNGKMLAMASSYDREMFRNMKGLSKRHHRIRLSVGDLPGAKREVEYLSKTFAGKYLYGEDANEGAFKAFSKDNSYSVVHLAMHGVVDAKQPEYSSLVFSYSGNKEEDDLLHAYELNLLDMKTDLVVLSACETGFGKYERGEGVVSLGRGFMYSGAPSLVMTLWPINDKATSIFIAEFYSQLAAGHDKDEAMRIAKLNYLENAEGLSTHPFFWASFINLGDYQPIQLKRQWQWWQLIGLLFIATVLGCYFYNRKREVA